MKVSYNGLWKILLDRGLKKQDLVNNAGVSWATIAKMGKGERVTDKVLEKIAVYLGCSLKDIYPEIL